MLRELNINEMEMVSGGSDDDEVVVTGTRSGNGNSVYGGTMGAYNLRRSAAQAVGQDINNLVNQSYYGGNMYPTEGAADVARRRNAALNDAYGDGSSENPGSNPQDAINFGDFSGISDVNTGTTVGTIGSVQVGVTAGGGVPPTSGSVTGSIKF